MKSFIFRCIASLSLVCMGCAWHQAIVNDQNSHWILTAEGQSFRFSDWRGQWILVHFWSMSDEHSQEDILFLNDLAKSVPGLVVIGAVHEPVSTTELKSIAHSAGIEYTLVQGDLLRRLNLRRLPLITKAVLVNPSGSVAAVWQTPVRHLDIKGWIEKRHSRLVQPLLAQHFYISGQVQRVNYRYCTKEKAQELGITGWMKNLPDGRVEVMAVGSKQALGAFERCLKQGSSQARVDEVIAVSSPLIKCQNFAIIN